MELRVSILYSYLPQSMQAQIQTTAHSMEATKEHQPKLSISEISTIVVIPTKTSSPRLNCRLLTATRIWRKTVRPNINPSHLTMGTRTITQNRVATKTSRCSKRTPLQLLRAESPHLSMLAASTSRLTLEVLRAARRVARCAWPRTTVAKSPTISNLLWRTQFVLSLGNTLIKATTSFLAFRTYGQGRVTRLWIV